jgi:GNAT acetyltransferase-like protein
MTLHFRLLGLHEIQWPRLDAFDDRVVFQTREWLNFLAESQSATPIVVEIRDGDIVAGYFSGLIVRKLGVRILGSSFPGWTTPYIGFNVQPPYSRAHLLEPLVRWVFQELRCLHVEISDRLLELKDGPAPAGMQQTTYRSYTSDLSKSEDELFGVMENACRRSITKAEQSGVTVEEAGDLDFADEYYAQLTDVLANQGRVPTYPVERVRLLLKHMLPTGRLLALRARNPEGHCIATCISAGMNRMAFFWGSASWRLEQQLRSSDYLHWYALRYWKSQGAKEFDWGGGGAYKGKYSVASHTVPWLYKSKHPWLTTVRNEAHTLLDRSQTFVGAVRPVSVHQPA